MREFVRLQRKTVATLSPTHYHLIEGVNHSAAMIGEVEAW
jgi:hypothetical protein